MSKEKKKHTEANQSNSPSFISDFKKIKWGKKKDKDPSVFNLFLKVLFVTAILTGILFGFESLITYVLGVVNA